MKKLLPLVAFTIVSGSVEAKTEKVLELNQKPNVIYIMMDDAGIGDFGCYGQEKIETPNVDALAARGIRFTNMYATAPLSGASRCGLMTGLHMGHAQIRHNLNIYPKLDFAKMTADSTLEGQVPLLRDTPTLASVVKKAGYTTGMVGKWGLGTVLEATPNQMGFDDYYGYICQQIAHSYYPPFMWDNDHRQYLPNEIVEEDTPLDEGADPLDPRSYDKYVGNVYSPDLMYDRVVEFISKNKNNPFFLMWTTNLPHSPLAAPERWIKHYVEKFGDEKPTEGKGYYPNRYPHATYAAMISYFDEQVGNMVKELKKQGIYDNTIIIFTSDNGPASNSCSSSEWFDSARPFSAKKGWGKFSLREGGIRMPFIVSYGDKLRPHVSDHMAMFCDMMPTLCDLSGAECPQTDGISFLPTLNEEKQPKHEFLYFEYPGGKGWVAVRWGKWKGHIRRVKAEDAGWELYDLEKDPREKNNLAAQHPEILDQMWQFITDSHRECPHEKFNFQLPEKSAVATTGKTK